MPKIRHLAPKLSKHLSLLPVTAILLTPYLYGNFSTFRHFLIFYIIGLARLRGNVKITDKRFVFSFVIIATFGFLISMTNGPGLLNTKYYLLLISPLISAFIFYGSLKHLIPTLIRQLFVFSCLTQIIVVMQSKSGLFSLGLFQVLSYGEDSTIFLSSFSDIESSFCFMFAYFSIFFFQKKHFGNFTLALFMTLLNYKRIVLVGLSLALFTEVIVNRLNYQSKWFGRLIWVAPYVGVTVLLMASTGQFNSIVKDSTGRGMDQLTTGRYEIHQELNKRLFTLPDIIFGHGIGTTHTEVSTFEFTRMTLAHSDYLMLFYDLGAFGFAALFVLLMTRLIRFPIQYSLTVFFLIVLALDNTIIYFDIMFLFYLLLLHIRKHSDTLRIDTIVSTKP